VNESVDDYEDDFENSSSPRNQSRIERDEDQTKQPVKEAIPAHKSRPAPVYNNFMTEQNSTHHIPTSGYYSANVDIRQSLATSQVASTTMIAS
jgi:hypothetical protein